MTASASEIHSEVTQKDKVSLVTFLPWETGKTIKLVLGYHTAAQLNQDFLREPEQPMAWGPSQGYYGRF